MKATYVTPRNAAMAVLNAMSEIRAREADTGTMMSDNEQCQIILAHLRDYFGGRVFVLQVKHMLSIKTLVELLCDTEECVDELRTLIGDKAA